MGLCKCLAHFQASQHQESAEALASTQAFTQAYYNQQKVTST